MPRKSTSDGSLEFVDAPASVSAPSPRMETKQDVSEKLDVVIMYLQKMDKRDRIRTWGGFARGMISLIPMLFFIWSIWYFAAHGDEIIKKITDESAKAATRYTQDQSGELMKQLQNIMPKK